MANFYKIVRTKMNLLMNKNGTPKGNKWSFDEENRKKLPNTIKVPVISKVKETKETITLKKFINSNFKDHPGNTDKFWFPTTRKDASKWLDEFLKERIKLFGDYEDAVTDKSNTVFHSALSPLINLGLIAPEEIIEKLRKIENKVPMNSLEGYIRQIIGWREFMRGIYQNYDQRLDNTNFFNHTWYEGNTGLDPLDHAINNAKNYGWSHHIERLMILANIMNLCEINPKQVYKWFMEMFVDSSDWVMAPNVYGMGLFSDGGIFATKPYICGSSYFLKMMHFKKGPWCDVMDGLYWKFIEKKILMVKVFFNNSCNICRAEINHYKKHSDNSVEWIDVTNNEEAQKVTSKSYKELLRRMHVIQDGKVIDGAESFLIIWKNVPKYNFLYKIFKIKPLFFILNIFYEIAAYFLFIKNKHLLKNEKS